jgi:hypothetical protein
VPEILGQGTGRVFTPTFYTSGLFNRLDRLAGRHGDKGEYIIHEGAPQ